VHEEIASIFSVRDFGFLPRKSDLLFLSSLPTKTLLLGLILCLMLFTIAVVTKDERGVVVVVAVAAFLSGVTSCGRPTTLRSDYYNRQDYIEFYCTVHVYTQGCVITAITSLYRGHRIQSSGWSSHDILVMG
jgi:hypothetical protein